MVKKIVAKRESSKTASVFRSSRTLTMDGAPADDGGGRGGGDDDADDAVASSGFGEDSELVETSSTRTIVLFMFDRV